MQFYIVDAFADELFGGNPAGVVIIPDGQDFPADEIMVNTAAELRYSETAFIKFLGGKEFNIRYFTPVAEVDLCGHATIASFATLLHIGMVTDGEYVNHTLAGDLNINIKDGFIFMDMAEPKLFQSITEPDKLQDLYRIMGLDYDLEKSKGLTLIPQIISTGLPDIMLPVSSFESLQRISPDFPKLITLSEEYDVTGVHAFVENPDEEGTYHVRNFGPRVGIDEESATGTSNGALTYYLSSNDLLRASKDCKFIQGEKMNRPSAIVSRIDEKGTIQIGGKGLILADGQINI